MLWGTLFLVAGLVLVVWSADRFTDGAVGTARVLAVSPFYVGVVVSGLEPENLVTGLAAAFEGLPQVALGTVVGSTVFLLTAALGVSLLLVPMDVRIPRAGPAAMAMSLVAFLAALVTGGDIGPLEGLLLVVIAASLLAWLYRRSPAFLPREDDQDEDAPGMPRWRVLGRLGLGLAGMLVGAELAVRGVHALVATMVVSETFVGMVVIGMGESLEEVARMVTPARRGRPEVAWGNVVGTVVILLGVNLGLIALAMPLTADPRVLHVHLPYLVGVVLLVAAALSRARRLGRGMGGLLLGLYVLYLGLNVWLELRYR
jgi:cation:H+ antiporter